MGRKHWFRDGDHTMKYTQCGRPTWYGTTTARDEVTCKTCLKNMPPALPNAREALAILKGAS